MTEHAKTRFGVTWVPRSVEGHASLAEQSERAGFELFGVPDSPAAGYRECYVCVTNAVIRTSRLAVGPLVTNPVTRHPGTVASALWSLGELGGERVFFCIGAGDTGVNKLGLRPAPVDLIEEYVVAVQALLSGERADFEGNSLELEFSPRSVPVFIAANGPRTLELAARIADGILVGAGVTDEVVARVDAACAQADRALEVWYMLRSSIHEDSAAAVREVLPAVVSAAKHVFQLPSAVDEAPAELRDAIRSLLQGYDMRFHTAPFESNPNAQHAEALGLADFLVDRLGMAGTPAQCRARLDELARRGIDRVMVRPLTGDPETFLRHWTAVSGASGSTRPEQA